MRPSTLMIALGLASISMPAWGQFEDAKSAPADAPVSSNSEIRDSAGMFGRDAAREGLARLVALERTYRIPVTIETVESLRGEPIVDATYRHAKRLGPQGKGIYILISKGDRKLEVIVSPDNTTLNVRPKRQAIRDAFLEEFGKSNPDLGLKRGVETIEKTLASIKGDDAKPATAASSRTVSTEAGFSTYVKHDRVKLTLAGAKRLVALAESASAEHGYKMNIAVVDDGGHLLAFSRMDDARPASATTAMTKAVSAATYRQSTGPLPGTGSPNSPDLLLNLSLQNAVAAGGGKFTTLTGGVPIEFEGQIIGAVGIGGGSTEQDSEVAQAALKQFLAEFKAAATTPAAAAK